jgi:hypothetical protein
VGAVAAARSAAAAAAAQVGRKALADLRMERF